MSSGFSLDNTRIYCKHMEEAVKRKSKTFKHPNRDFYCCKRPVGGQDKCDFFLWADEAPPKSSIVDAPVSDGGPKQYEQVLSVPGPPLKETEASTSPSGVAADGPQPPSPVPTEVDGDSEAEVKPARSFLGLLDPSPQPIKSVVQEVEGRPSTPKKPRLSQTIASKTQPTTERSISCGSGSLPTPPQTRTTRHFTEAQFNGPNSAPSRTTLAGPSTGRKGKEGEGVFLSQVQDQDNHAGDNGKAGRSDRAGGDALPLFTHPDDATSTSSASPTIAENVLDYTDGLRARVKVLSEYMDSFDIVQATKSLQTVERQKMQYECRNQNQKTRIAELVAEKNRLFAEVSRLKEALERSEDNNRAKDAEIAGLKSRSTE